MLKRVLDTCILVAYWKLRRSKTVNEPSVQMVEQWARDLASIHQGDAIVTPIQVEFIAGTRDAIEHQLAEAFLGQFKIIDEGSIPKNDWEATLQTARRIPRNGKPRQLGDCLIRAIARRLKYEMVTVDEGFPK